MVSKLQLTEEHKSLPSGDEGRIEFIDVAKGIAICLVVLGHTWQTGDWDNIPLINKSLTLCIPIVWVIRRYVPGIVGSR